MRRLAFLVVGAMGCSFSTDVEGTNGGLGSAGSTGEASSSASATSLPPSSSSSASSSATGDASTSVGTTVGASDGDTSTTAPPDPPPDTTGGSGEPTSATTTGPSSAGSTAAAAATCDEIYGTAPGYILCTETGTDCSFNATTDGTCTAMCMLFGGTCLDAHDNPNDAGLECTMTDVDSDTCETVRGTEICVCSKP